MSQTPRNAPCPCGSGKKYKHCCIGKSSAVAPSRKAVLVRWMLIALVVGFLLAIIVLNLTKEPEPPSTPGMTPMPTQSTPRSMPPPWFYDEANNRHWDPSHGHEHWHPGPPPPESQR